MFFSSAGPAWQPNTELVSRAGLQWADVVEGLLGCGLVSFLLLFFSVLFSFLFSIFNLEFPI
jgi:ABC-type phosphate/phosphonate transport system permease subunit